MTALRINAAAERLGVTPSTLRSWEQRYSYPVPSRTTGGHRTYDSAQIDRLADALVEVGGIAAAVELVRDTADAPPNALQLAKLLSRFDEDGASALLQQSLALGPLEKTASELLLPAIATLSGNAQSPEFQFAARFTTGWLAAVKRSTAPASRPEGVLLLEASAELTLDALYTQAFELTLRRAGLRTLALTLDIDTDRLARAAKVVSPSALVISGTVAAGLDLVGRSVHAVRSSTAGTVKVFDYRSALPNTGASTVRRLDEDLLAGRNSLLTDLAETAAVAPVQLAAAVS